MRDLTLLIKPASGHCNMRCEYCFYADETASRDVPNYGMMQPDVLEALVQKALQAVTGTCTFAFQGGEPTLAGLSFYQTLIDLVQRHNHNNVHVQYALQTNGYLIDHDWAAFLGKHRFLVGLSLDGDKAIHDTYRPDYQGKGTFSVVMHAAQLFRSHQVDFNILTVVTKNTTAAVGRIYRFFTKHDFLYQQYILCLDPYGTPQGTTRYSLSAETYGRFLKQLFDLWYGDVSKGKPVSIRYFDNLLGMLMGMPPESCGMMGCCQLQYVIEANGNVYPCDFYAMDDFLIGNITTDSFQQLDETRRDIQFIEFSQPIDPHCMTCQWKNLCRGGCRRNRDHGDKQLHLNDFCPAYRSFFEYAYPRLSQLANRLRTQPR